MDFNIEQKSLIHSLNHNQKISRVAVIRRMLKLKSIETKENHSIIDDAVRKLCRMTDQEYAEYDFEV